MIRIIFENIETVFNLAVKDWRFIVNAPENNVSVWVIFGIIDDGFFSGADEFGFSFFGVAPGAAAQELFGYSWGDSNH